MASHNEIADLGHKPAFPDQSAIRGFLRGLIGKGRNQVTWARDAEIPYNTITNWFAEDTPDMKAVSLLRLVIAAGAWNELATWLASYRPAGDNQQAERAMQKAEAELQKSQRQTRKGGTRAG